MKICQSFKAHKGMSALAMVAWISYSTLLCGMGTQVVYAQSQVNNATSEARKVPALRSAVLTQLNRAQQAADSGDNAEALAILDAVKAKSSSMNSYERATMHNTYGFIYYAQEKIDNTIASFKEAINQSPIPISFEQSALFSLAQLSMAKGNFDEVIAFIERWESLNKGVIPPKNYILKAQALYQQKAYKKAAYYIETAIAGHEDEGYLPNENWLLLQRAIYFEMQQPEKVKDIIVKLIRLYDQPKYWIQLAGMYGELEQEQKQLATMEIAYQRGFVNTASDIFNLAQLYYYHGVPFKGASLMEKALKKGVLKEDLRNLTFLAQAWQGAKEDEKAVPVMVEAASMSEDGKLDAQLALLYYNLEDFDSAINSANLALSKGNLDRPGDTHMVLGLSLYSVQDFSQALDQLAKAEEFTSSRSAARQWRQYVEKEKSGYEFRNTLAAAR